MTIHDLDKTQGKIVVEVKINTPLGLGNIVMVTLLLSS